MKKRSILSLIAIAAAACIGLNVTSGDADAQDFQNQASANSLIVAELFTSQSCSSCPPAEAFFSELADRENLLTLEWHVDYWDKLVHGGSKWKDRYSDNAYTERQRSYNATIRGTRGVYTPQAIINGDLEGVGNRRSQVTNIIDTAPALSLPVNIQNDVVKVGPHSKSVEVLFVRLLKEHETDVKGGENKGRKLFGKNIVLQAEVLGQTRDTQSEFKLPKLNAGESCAVLVQSLSGDTGPILGAAKCG